MKKNTAIPAIRFKGFTAPWEQRELGNIFKYEQPQAYIVKNTKYNESFKIPVLTAGQSFILGYTDENFGVKNASSESPVIIFDDFTTASHFVDFSFKIKSSAMKLLTLNNPNDNVQCAYQILQNLSYTPLTHSRHWISTFSKFKVLIPESNKEQNQIGALFSNLERLITLHQRKSEQLLTIKKSMLEKMFPQKGSCYPEIRFKGFTAPWEQCKLGDVGKARSGFGFPESAQGGTSGLPFFKVSDMNVRENEREMLIAKNYVTASQMAAHNWTPIEELPAIFFAKVGAAVMLNRKRLCRFPFLLDNNTMAFSLHSAKWDADFAKTCFETVNLTSLVQVGALPSYNSRDVEMMSIQLPTLLEQKAIGEFFSYFDRLITLHQRKLKKLHNIKKSMLEKMFV